MVRMRSCRDPDVSVLLDGGVTGIDRDALRRFAAVDA
jgi:hypothetical protein